MIGEGRKRDKENKKGGTIKESSAIVARVVKQYKLDDGKGKREREDICIDR